MFVFIVDVKVNVKGCNGIFNELPELIPYLST